MQRKIFLLVGIFFLLLASCATNSGTVGEPQRLVRIEGGIFHMGNNEGPENEKPLHTVVIKSFRMSNYPVTQKEWKALMKDNPAHFQGANRPVERVSWYDAVEYCNRLSRKEGLTPVYVINGLNVIWDHNADGYRLPTEAEWEYAASGGSGVSDRYVYSGSDNVDEVAWYEKNSEGSTQEVGSKKANSLGLYDMSGNVLEWCWDWYDGRYYLTVPANNPTGPSSGTMRTARGGGWYFSAQTARLSCRLSFPPSFRVDYLGFRLVRDV